MTSSAIAVRSKLQKYVPPDVPPPDAMFYDAGGSTFHRHTCPENPPHVWLCNSPYCNSLHDLCPDHGGPEPVSIGREPWRGR